MPWQPMYFKGRRVFVEVDDGQQPVLQDGRARMRYQVDDERIYNPWPAHLSTSPNTPATTATRSQTAAKRRAPSPAATPQPGPGDIQAWTDGGCIGNPGPSGLGFLIVFPDGTRVERGEALGEGTNNIAELTAIWRVLQTLDDRGIPKTTRLLIHTDSTYAIGMLTANWKAKQNQQLVADIRNALKQRNAVFIKVPAHAGNPNNERVDELANTSARTQQNL